MPLLWQAAHQATIQFVAALRLYSVSQARASFQSGKKVKQREGGSHGGVDGGWRRGSDGDAKRFSIALLLKAVKPTCRAEMNEPPALPHCLSFRSLLSLHTLDKADNLLPLIPACSCNCHQRESQMFSRYLFGEMDHYLRALCPSTSANSRFAISARRVCVEVCVRVWKCALVGSVGWVCHFLLDRGWQSLLCTTDKAWLEVRVRAWPQTGELQMKKQPTELPTVGGKSFLTMWSVMAWKIMNELWRTT